ncbi:MAG: SPFH/Band 7/PHB domain protein [Mailhella sp.]|nr:SPFH/Band 7/PHB domain protein [Mailhella sp.]
MPDVEMTFIPLAATLAVLAVFIMFLGIRIVPQQQGWVVERLGRFHGVLEPGLNFIIPLIDRVAYRHSLKEIPMDTDAQVCITRDNTQLRVDGVLYFQVTDARLASYGTSNYRQAITQLAQTSLRSVIGQMELDRTFEERDEINMQVVRAVDEAAKNWGVKVLRYEIKDLTPPDEILRAMQRQITAEREKRALIAASEGKKHEAINLAEGQRAALISQSEGEKQSAINRAEGEARSIEAVASAQAEAIRVVAAAIGQEGGMDAVNLQVAEKYVDAFAKVARQGNTLILPANMGDMASLVASALSIVKAQK